MIFIVDFDGTLAPRDALDSLLARFASPHWQALEADWQAGRITPRTCIQAQIRLVEASRLELEAFFHDIELDPGFAEFCRAAQPLGEVAIVSDGLDYPIRLLMDKGRLPKLRSYANKLHFSPHGLDLSFPFASHDCHAGSGTCKCRVAQNLAERFNGPVVLIGDGRSDFCLAGQADRVFAKSALRRHCEAQNIAHFPFETFDDVRRELQRWEASPARPTLQHAGAL